MFPGVEEYKGATESNVKSENYKLKQCVKQWAFQTFLVLLQARLLLQATVGPATGNGRLLTVIGLCEKLGHCYCFQRN